jgi:hypothetical protein
MLPPILVFYGPCRKARPGKRVSSSGDMLKPYYLFVLLTVSPCQADLASPLDDIQPGCLP